MPSEPRWTNDITRRVAHAMLKACQPTGSGDSEQVDWPQVVAWLEAHRDAAIAERDRTTKKRPH